MAKEKIFEEFKGEIKPEEAHSQVLIKIDSNTFEEAKKIIADSGTNIIAINYLTPHWVLFKLDVKDMRNIALQLTENGFLNIKGINATHNK
jgi:hypothetical protein